MQGQSGFVATIFLVLIVVGAGCGGDEAKTDSSSATIAGQVTRYYAALDRGDGRAACDLLTEEAAKGFEAVINGPVSADCKTNIETLSRVSLLRSDPRVTRIKSTGEDATAHVAFEDPEFESDVLLVRDGGTWKFAQIPAIVGPTP